MLPGFPPGVFPFWGPFPAVPPPAAPPSASDAPQSSSEAPQASGKGGLLLCQTGEKQCQAVSIFFFFKFCVRESYQAAVRPPHPMQTLRQLLLLRRDPRCQASPFPCLRLHPSPAHRGHRSRHFLPSVSTTVLYTYVDNGANHVCNTLKRFSPVLTKFSSGFL